jgi:hypothetical protein
VGDEPGHGDHRSLRLSLLDEADRGVEYDDDQDHDRVGGLADGEREHSDGDQNRGERAADLAEDNRDGRLSVRFRSYRERQRAG